MRVQAGDTPRRAPARKSAPKPAPGPAARPPSPSYATSGAPSGAGPAPATGGAGAVATTAGTAFGGGTGATDAAGLPEMTGETFTGLPATTKGTDAAIEAQAWAKYQSTATLQRYVRTQYGYVGTWLSQVPEVGPILVAAAMHGWDQARFDAAVMQTQWWQTTSQAQRNFQEVQATDPGEAAQQVLQAQDTVLNAAQSLGIALPAGDVKQLATSMVTFNWSSGVLSQVLRQQYAQATSSPQFGAAATFADQARQLAGEYAIALPTSTLAAYVKQNEQGTLTADGLQTTMTNQAMHLYPWMSTALSQGVTPSQYLSSYASAAAQTLGIDPSDVTWTTPKWTKALLTDQHGQSQTAPVSIGVFQQNLMRTPSYGYQHTQGARDAAYAMAKTVLSTFGKVA